MSVKAELTVKKENTVKHSQLEFSGIKRLSFPPPINSTFLAKVKLLFVQKPLGQSMKQSWSNPWDAAKSLQSCPTLCDPIDGGPPGSPVPGILQASTLEWVAIAFSNA